VCTKRKSEYKINIYFHVTSIELLYKSVQLIHVSFDNIFLMFKIKFRVPGSFICKRIVIVLMFKIKCINACALITDYAKNILKTHIAYNIWHRHLELWNRLYQNTSRFLIRPKKNISMFTATCQNINNFADLN
jgi:hypothetical protein